MGLLVGIALLVGLLTALTPCVLPVLPIVLATGTGGSRRRPYAIVLGLVTSFTLFTLFWTAILEALPLPADLLRNLAIALIALTAVSLVVPRVAELAERPFQRLGRLRPRADGSGFLLGLALGLVFTPCAGLLIGSVASAAATQEYSLRLIVVVLAYAAGAAVSLLAIMLAARRGLALARVRAAAPRLRQGLGVAMAAVVAVLALGLDARLAAKVPDYLEGALSLQESERVAAELAELAPVTGIAAAASAVELPASAAPAVSPPAEQPAPAPAADAPAAAPAPVAETPELALARSLPDFGRAPEFTGIQSWLNGEPTTLADLRGKVVVIDFWTYSCVNCLRTLPHLRRWHERYADQGLVLVGVHTPEFAFEAVPANVQRAVRDLGVEWPVALDPEYGTWSAWGNRYWPAKYFIDRRGNVRYAHFGEGAYEESEEVIRGLLADGAPAGTRLPDRGPALAEGTRTGEQTAETYLGHLRVANVAAPVRPDTVASYRLPDELADDQLAFGGQWRILGEQAVAGRDARLRLRFRGRAVHLVLGPDDRGGGAVEVLVDGERLPPVAIAEHRLYTLAEPGDDAYHELELRFSPGVAGYAFTFGVLEPDAVDPASRRDEP